RRIRAGAHCDAINTSAKATAIPKKVATTKIQYRANMTYFAAPNLCPRVALQGLEPSIRFEMDPVDPAERLLLILLAQDRITDHEQAELRSHEASECILRGADDRLAAHIEAGVDEHRASRSVAGNGE